jgi:aspartate racemase
MPDSPVYIIPAGLRLRGELNIQALEKAFSEMVKRHEILRTRFPSIDGYPVQMIAPPQPVGLPAVDLSELPEDRREAEAKRLAADEAQKPFDLAQGPLLRLTLVKLSGEDHMVLSTIHHIISDGWSTSIFAREIAALYEACAKNVEPRLEELPIQYADFAVWQRQFLQGEQFEEQLSYWKAQLGGELPELKLPIDRPRPALQTYSGAGESLSLPADFSKELKQLCLREDVTLFMVILAALDVLFGYHCGQEDIVVGSNIAGRNRIELEGLIGMFVNVLVLRTDLSGDPTLRELLARVRRVTLEAYAHQDVPFDRLVEELRPERSLSKSPLVQVVIQSQNYARETFELPGFSLSPVGNENVYARSDLVVLLSETSRDISISFRYNGDLFNGATVAAWLTHLNVILKIFTTNPLARLSETHRLLKESDKQRQSLRQKEFKAARQKMLERRKMQPASI